MSRALMALVAVFVLAACLPAPVGPAVADDDVDAACAAWRRLGCPEGKPTPGGVTCEQWSTRGLSVGASPRAACVVAAGSCETARACWGTR